MPPAVALLNYISCGILWKIFCQTGTFRGVFCTYHWYRRIHPTLWFFAVFFYLLFAGKISEAAMWGAGLPECMPHRRNWFPPPPHPDVSVSPSLDPKGGGATLSCSWVGGGTQFGRLDRRPGTLYTVLSGLGSRVERKRPFTRPAKLIIFYFWNTKKKQQQSFDGWGARSALFGVPMSPKRRARSVRARTCGKNPLVEYIYFPSSTVHKLCLKQGLLIWGSPPNYFTQRTYKHLKTDHVQK